MASIVTQQEQNVQEKEKKRKPSPYNNNKKKTNKTTKQTQLNDDSDDPKTKSFKAIIKLIGKTITKKPKNKAKRLEFSNLVQENEQKVFEIIRGNPMPIIYIFQFLEYIYNYSGHTLRHKWIYVDSDTYEFIILSEKDGKMTELLRSAFTRSFFKEK